MSRFQSILPFTPVIRVEMPEQELPAVPGFHRVRGSELVGSCSLKRTGPVGLVGLQRRRTNYMWDSLAELKGALHYPGAFQKMQLGKELPDPVVCIAAWMVVGSLRAKIVPGHI